MRWRRSSKAASRPRRSTRAAGTGKAGARHRALDEHPGRLRNADRHAPIERLAGTHEPYPWRARKRVQRACRRLYGFTRKRYRSAIGSIARLPLRRAHEGDSQARDRDGRISRNGQRDGGSGDQELVASCRSGCTARHAAAYARSRAARTGDPSRSPVRRTLSSSSRGSAGASAEPANEAAAAGERRPRRASRRPSADRCARAAEARRPRPPGRRNTAADRAAEHVDDGPTNGTHRGRSGGRKRCVGKACRTSVHSPCPARPSARSRGRRDCSKLHGRAWEIRRRPLRARFHQTEQFDCNGGTQARGRSAENGGSAGSTGDGQRLGWLYGVDERRLGCPLYCQATQDAFSLQNARRGRQIRRNTATRLAVRPARGV